MGYSITEGMVEDNAPILDRILMGVKRGEAVVFKCHPHLLSKNNYRMHNLLKATNVLTKEANGKYSGLRSRVKVIMDSRRSAIIVEPKHGTVQLSESLVPMVPDEDDAIEILKNFQGETKDLKFTPSSGDFNIEDFAQRIQAIGFKLARNIETGEYVIITDEESDEIMVLAERVEKRKKHSAFDVLKRPDFTPPKTSDNP